MCSKYGLQEASANFNFALCCSGVGFEGRLKQYLPRSLVNSRDEVGVPGVNPKFRARHPLGRKLGFVKFPQDCSSIGVPEGCTLHMKEEKAETATTWRSRRRRGTADQCRRRSEQDAKCGVEIPDGHKPRSFSCPSGEVDWHVPGVGNRRTYHPKSNLPYRGNLGPPAGYANQFLIDAIPTL